jgi:pentatricopeptide repeat protein
VRVFHEMVEGGEAQPNEVTIVSVLSACSSIGALNLGQWVHSYIDTRSDLTEDGSVGNALINMYVKCGDVGMAIQVFNILMRKDIISWSTVFSCIAYHYNRSLFFFFSVYYFVPKCSFLLAWLMCGRALGGSRGVNMRILAFAKCMEICSCLKD